MTPTEQDKELREAILLEFKNIHKLAPADYTENCTNIVMQLILADRKKHELQARLSEREAVSREQSKPILTTNERISELKQELEKL